MAVKRISSFVTNSGETKGVLRHRGMSYYQRGSSGITQKVFTGVRFDRHVASLLSRFKHNAKLLVIKLARPTDQFVVSICCANLFQQRAHWGSV